MKFFDGHRLPVLLGVAGLLIVVPALSLALAASRHDAERGREALGRLAESSLETAFAQWCAEREQAIRPVFSTELAQVSTIGDSVETSGFVLDCGNGFVRLLWEPSGDGFGWQDPRPGHEWISESVPPETAFGLDDLCRNQLDQEWDRQPSGSSRGPFPAVPVEDRASLREACDAAMARGDVGQAWRSLQRLRGADCLGRLNDLDQAVAVAVRSQASEAQVLDPVPQPGKEPSGATPDYSITMIPEHWYGRAVGCYDDHRHTAPHALLDLLRVQPVKYQRAETFWIWANRNIPSGQWQFYDGEWQWWREEVQQLVNLPAAGQSRLEAWRARWLANYRILDQAASLSCRSRILEFDDWRCEKVIGNRFIGKFDPKDPIPVCMLYDKRWLRHHLTDVPFAIAAGGDRRIDLTRWVEILLDGPQAGDERRLLARHVLTGEDLWIALALGLRREAVLDLAAAPGSSLPLTAWLGQVLAMVLGLGLMAVFLVHERRLAGMRTRFVAEASHELKTPVTIIRLQAETLALDRLQDPATRASYARSIASEALRLGNLIEKILAFARHDAGKPRFAPRDCDLADIARAALAMFADRHATQGRRFTCNAPESLPACADPDALAQILFNLLDNAVRYGGDGPVEVQLERSPEHIELVVRDHGPGIPPADRARARQPFVRLGQDARGGTGLGLAVVDRLVTSHGGTLSIDDAPGGGCQVVVRLPPAGSLPTT